VVSFAHAQQQRLVHAGQRCTLFPFRNRVLHALHVGVVSREPGLRERCASSPRS
jgi:hypothetical protein